jgi:ribose 5-phosphate isomerase B
MKIAIGADHAGFALKQALKSALLARGLEVEDLGTHADESTDYPDYAALVASRVRDGAAERGILCCSTGVGMAIAANKVHGVRAAAAFSDDEVALTRAHNDANVLTVGARYFGLEEATRMIDIFLNTPFEGGRHERRVNKIADMERARA